MVISSMPAEESVVGDADTLELTMAGSHLAEPHIFTALHGEHFPPDNDHGSISWTTVLAALCRFPPEVFELVMLDLVHHPNLTSSNIVRADIADDSAEPSRHGRQSDSGVDSNIDPAFDTQDYEAAGWHQDRVILRRFIPRNQQRDRVLKQTCLFLSQATDESIESLIVYLPHVMRAEEMPHYHPAVKKLAFHHSFPRHPSPLGPGKDVGKISLAYEYFNSEHREDDNRLDRTALKLLQTVHKHGEGQLTGYEKRVHHDQVIPQKRYQDTYARLKAKYGKQLTTNWVEVTDPVKHVFEDIGIAAFLIELWDDTYHRPATAKAVLLADADADQVAGADDLPENPEKRINKVESESLAKGGEVQQHVVKTPFPGFVDIGCGNGILVYVLLSEGYPGFGFDARERKSWTTFPTAIKAHLKQQILVPEVLVSSLGPENDVEASWHIGNFDRGTFIISNHADELTAWTPLLAYLNHGAFLAIPCCSHDLAGARFRAPESVRKPTDSSLEAADRNAHMSRLPQQDASACAESTLNENRSKAERNSNEAQQVTSSADLAVKQAAETGSLKRTLVQKKMSSAYSTLCSYLASISEAVGFEVETEVLRIPSTRNHSVIGRHGRNCQESDADEGANREVVVATLIEQEMGVPIRNVAHDWVMRAGKIAQKPGSGH